MPQKIFLVNPKVEYSSKETVNRIHNERLSFGKETWEKREQLADKAMHEECKLRHVAGRVIVRINLESKNTHTFANGMIIRRERAYNNFNFREVNPSNAIVISAENIPTGAEILFDYLSLHDSNKIFSYKTNSPDVAYYSFKEDEVYAWRIGENEFQPTTNYDFGLRVFRPYSGALVGIQPTRLNDVLYVTTGELKGKIVRVLMASDYEIVFTDKGVENNIIRFRHSSKPDYDRDEVICIADDLTEELNNGKLLIGLNVHDAKKLHE